MISLDPKKYPYLFDGVDHAVVYKTYRGKGWLFEGVVKIVRRKGDLITIQSNTSPAQFTFKINKDHLGHEKGVIGQSKKSNMFDKRGARLFDVIPYIPWK